MSIDFNQLVLACRSAGQEILRIAKAGQENCQIKGDGTPVTFADLRANEIVSAALDSYGGGLPVVSEESENETHPGADFWLLDPLDGTKDFIKGMPEYGVNLALVRDHKVVWGCIDAPALGQCFVGDRLVQSCQKITVVGVENLRLDSRRLHPKLRPNCRILMSINHPDPETLAILGEISGAQKVQVGSSLKFCAIAEGRADWYPRRVGLSQWDMAAGHAILAAAGGNVWDWSGNELEYGLRSDGYGSEPFEAW